MLDPITDAAQVTPTWLEGVLDRAGCLPRGRVRGLQVSPQETTTSSVPSLLPESATTTSKSRKLCRLSDSSSFAR